MSFWPLTGPWPGHVEIVIRAMRGTFLRRRVRTLVGFLGRAGLALSAARNDKPETNPSANGSFVERSQSIMRYGFCISTQRSTVSRVPPIGSPFEIISVPSSATFCAVRSAYRHLSAR